jgi:hypothetical protein
MAWLASTPGAQDDLETKKWPPSRDQHPRGANYLASAPCLPPEPGTEDADFLARLNEVYDEESDLDDERLIARMRATFRRVLERER